MRRIAINARDRTPCDAYVYHYSFNRSHLVYVRSTCVIYKPTEVAIPAIKILALMKSFQHSRWNIYITWMVEYQVF